MKYSERELVELTMQYGFDGCELNNKHFKEKGFLKKSSNLTKAFEKKLDAICISWKRLRKIKKETEVYYEVDGFKDEIEGYIGGRGSGNLKIDNHIAQIIYNYMIKYPTLLKNNRTYKKWAEILGLPYSFTNPESVNPLLKFIGDIYSFSHALNILNQFTKRIENRSGDVMKSVFKILEREGKIKVHTIYCGITKNKEVKEFNMDGYNKVKEELGLYLKDFGLDYTKWYFGKRDDKIAEVEEKLLNKHDVKNIFKQYHVELIHNEPNDSYTDDPKDTHEVYFNRVLELAAQRQAKMDKKNFDDLFPFDREHLSLMKLFIDVLYLGREVETLESVYPDDIQLMKKNASIAYMNYMSKLEKEKSNKHIGFNTYEESNISNHTTE